MVNPAILPVEIWDCVFECEEPKEKLVAWRVCHFWTSILHQNIFNLFIRLLPDMKNYLSKNDLLRSSVTCRLWKSGVSEIVWGTLHHVGSGDISPNWNLIPNIVIFDNVEDKLSTLSDDLEKHFSCRSLPPMELSLTLTTELESNYKVDYFFRTHGSKVVNLKLKLCSNSILKMRQECQKYLHYTQNLRRFELEADFFVESQIRLSVEDFGLAGNNGRIADRTEPLPQPLTLPFLKALHIQTEYKGERMIVMAQRPMSIGRYFANMFHQQFNQITTFQSIMIDLSYFLDYRDFSMLTQLDMLARTPDCLTWLPSISRFRIKKLTVRFHWVRVCLSEVCEISPAEQMEYLSILSCFKNTLTELHIEFQVFVHHEIFPFSHFKIDLPRLTTLTITNAFFSRRFEGLKSFTSIQNIHVILHELVHPQQIIGSYLSDSMIWEELPTLQVFTYQKQNHPWVFESRQIYEQTRVESS